MADDLTYLKVLNEEYKTWTGEVLYLYASQATERSKTVYSFVSGNITGLSDAEGYLRWALYGVQSGAHSHDEIAHITPTEEMSA
jgi:hypothetical protein